MRIGNSQLKNSSELTEEDLNKLPKTEDVMNKTFWIGVWPGITKTNIDYIIDKIKCYIY